MYEQCYTFLEDVFGLFPFEKMKGGVGDKPAGKRVSFCGRGWLRSQWWFSRNQEHCRNRPDGLMEPYRKARTLQFTEDRHGVAIL